MVIEILIPQGNPIDPLPHQIQNGVFDQVRITMVRETRAKPRRHPQTRIQLPKQQRATV
jgi:hypothetical protein